MCRDALWQTAYRLRLKPIRNRRIDLTGLPAFFVNCTHTLSELACYLHFAFSRSHIFNRGSGLAAMRAAREPRWLLTTRRASARGRCTHQKEGVPIMLWTALLILLVLWALGLGFGVAGNLVHVLLVVAVVVLILQLVQGRPVT